MMTGGNATRVVQLEAPKQRKTRDDIILLHELCLFLVCVAFIEPQLPLPSEYLCLPVNVAPAISPPPRS